MSRTIKVVSFDPSMSNWGICKASVNVDTLDFTVDDLILVRTESEAKKGIIKHSDDLRRAKEVQAGMIAACEGHALAISEIPLGNAAMYNNAILNAGIVVGVLASCPIPLLQVFPQDVKMLACGSRHAAKEEVIEWAMNKYPTAPWLLRKFKGKMVPTKDNEHLADAVAALNAGLRTAAFQQTLSMYKAMAA